MYYKEKTMQNQKILIIEDDEDIMELVEYNLKKSFYQTICASSGEAGLDMIQKHTPDLVLLDLMLPGINGFEVCKEIKNNTETQKTPVIMLTAKGEDHDIVAGLEIGADDYITKPFSPSVLIARVKSALRKQTGDTATDKSIIKIEDMVIHAGKYQVLIKDEILDLTITEFNILHLLAKRPGWAFSRYQIVSLVKGDDYCVTDRAVDVMIVGLRKKLGEYGHYIETVRGVGYKFKG